jgi:hypothetical protein
VWQEPPVNQQVAMVRLLGFALVAALESISAAAHAQTRGEPPAIPDAQDQGPTTYSRIGSTTFGLYGSKAERIGNTTFIEKSDGTTARCETIGDETFCDK